MQGRYNVRSPAVKRLMKEAQELSEPTDQYYAQPLEDNLFEWHFTVRGPADSDFQNGIYHGRIILPVDYPMKPPSIIWLTPNGRFETNKKICLSISGHHPESWQPSWSIRTALLAIIGFMPTHPGGAIGSLDYKPEERKILAKKSRAWKCPVCDDVSVILLEATSDSQSASAKEVQELASQISFQGEKPKGKAEANPSEDSVQKDKKEECSTHENGSTETPASNLSRKSSESTSTTTAAAEPTDDNSQTTAKSTSATSDGVSNGSRTDNGSTNLSQTPQMPNNVGPGTFAFCPPTSSSLPSGYHHLSSPWNAAAANPPFQFPNFYPPGQNIPHSMAAMPARFPYPPSHYTMASSSSFYPPGCALPPGVGMFPCPFPPAPSYSRPTTSPAINLVSVNNSSAPAPASSSSSSSSRAPSSVNNYTRTPMTCPPCTTTRYHQMAAASSAERPTTAASACREASISPEEKAEHKKVLNELLTKVKRVGSDDKGFVETKDSCKGAQPEDESNLGDDGSVEEESPEENKSNVRDSSPPHGESENINSEIGADSEVSKSKSLKRQNSGGDVSNSDIFLSDTDNSELGLPPMEVSDSEQRSAFEKSACYSTTGMERRKNKKQPSAKGLRHRQSTTANVTTEAGEDVPSTPADSSRQRIEAVSGDARPRNRSQRGQQGAPRAQHMNRDAEPQGNPDQPVSFNVTVFLMVVLFVFTVAIFLNRMLGIAWVQDFTGKPV